MESARSGDRKMVVIVLATTDFFQQVAERGRAITRTGSFNLPGVLAALCGPCCRYADPQQQAVGGDSTRGPATGLQSFPVLYINDNIFRALHKVGNILNLRPL